jgi:hypothetical protein
LTDQTAYDDFLVNSLRVTAAIQDTVASNDTPITVLRAINSIADGLDVFATLTIDGDTFSGHVLNTETRYATEYANYPFNSFAEFNGKLYGASQYGLFELTGDTDDGTAIEAYFKTGLMKLADGKLARVPSCYLGYTSDGTLVLKATVTSEKGEKQEYWYELRQQTAEVMREGRIKLGRGLQSVYWQFELHNVKGSDFHFDTIEFFPMILDRRIRK